MFIVANDIPANCLKGRICLAVMYLEFDNFSYVHYVYFHASWPPTRRARPERIPVVCIEIVGLFDHESALVVKPLTMLTTLANSLDSDQARNFVKVSNCFKLLRMYT